VSGSRKLECGMRKIRNGTGSKLYGIRLKAQGKKQLIQP
jgi:hypothetical protein